MIAFDTFLHTEIWLHIIKISITNNIHVAMKLVWYVAEDLGTQNYRYSLEGTH